MSIFKAYDIRGVFPEEINEKLACDIGKAAATFFNVKTLVVGRDMRVSSPVLSEAMIEGITSCGVDVVDIGMVSTPALYFAVGHYGYPGGIMVTASHNPAKYNGCKMCREQAIPVSGETGIKDMEKMVKTGQFKKADKKGKVITKDVTGDYVRHVLKFAHGIKAMKVVIDTGNGIVGKYLPKVYAELPCAMVPMYFEPDGRFPHHEANPLKEENMADLKKMVKAQKADLGIAFDGDGDRVAFVDENGDTISNDLVEALIAREILSEKGGQTIVYDLRSSKIVAEEIERSGGKAIESRVGHSFIKAIMRKNDAALGGELSGHYYFRDNYYADSGQIAMMKFMNLISKEGKKVSEIVNPLRKYFATGEINFEVEDKDGKMKELAAAYKDGEVYYLDGISVKYPDWWFNVRPSNTEPALRLNLEANTKALMEKKKAEIVALLEK